MLLVEPKEQVFIDVPKEEAKYSVEATAQAINEVFNVSKGKHGILLIFKSHIFKRFQNNFLKTFEGKLEFSFSSTPRKNLKLSQINTRRISKKSYSKVFLDSCTVS